MQKQTQKKWRNASERIMFVSRYLNADKVREVKEISIVTDVKLSAVEWCQNYFFRHKRQKNKENKQNKSL